MLDITTASTDPASKYARPTLEQLINRPAWMADALCREHPEVNFFLERGERHTGQDDLRRVPGA